MYIKLSRHNFLKEHESQRHFLAHPDQLQDILL
jgi:hypothetical protein